MTTVPEFRGVEKHRLLKEAADMAGTLAAKAVDHAIRKDTYGTKEFKQEPVHAVEEGVLSFRLFQVRVTVAITQPIVIQENLTWGYAPESED